MTGAGGFIGKNLVSQLKNIRDGKERHSVLKSVSEIMEYDLDTGEDALKDFCKRADFVYNLAGVNRPENADEFMAGNFGFADRLLSFLKEAGNKCPVMLSSSIQAKLDNPYGRSKSAGEKLFRDFSRTEGNRVLIYRFKNVFGKWCRSDYNSVVATFCYHIANDLPIRIDDPETVLNLVYIDDVVEELIGAAAGEEHYNEEDGLCFVPVSHRIKLGELSELIRSFEEGRKRTMVPDMADPLIKKLYSTYLSYLPAEKTAVELNTKADHRGSFTELFKSRGAGQVSVNITRPGERKGDHWHHTKCERFVVIKGHGLIEERRIGAGPEEIRRYEVNGEEMKMIEMLPGFTHDLINLSDTEDMITLIWANEIFDENRPDTFSEKV